VPNRTKPISISPAFFPIDPTLAHCSVRLTNELAAQKPGRARLACNTAVASTFLYGLLLLIVLLSIHGHWGKLFIPRDSDGLGQLLDQVAPYAAVLQFFESLQIVLQGEAPGRVLGF
jgi:Na+-driven multidrug efflux pump